MKFFTEKFITFSKVKGPYKYHFKTLKGLQLRLTMLGVFLTPVCYLRVKVLFTFVLFPFRICNFFAVMDVYCSKKRSDIQSANSTIPPPLSDLFFHCLIFLQAIICKTLFTFVLFPFKICNFFQLWTCIAPKKELIYHMQISQSPLKWRIFHCLMCLQTFHPVSYHLTHSYWSKKRTKI